MNNNLKNIKSLDIFNKKQLKCNKCKLVFNDKISLEKHNWSKHPSNEYELHHSKITNWSNLPLAYRDDPYY